MSGCFDISDCLKKWHEIINNEQSYTGYTSTPSYSIKSLNPQIKNIKNIPIPYRSVNVKVTSDMSLFGYSNSNINFPFVNAVTFCVDSTNNPYKVNWKSQVLNLSPNVGCYNGSWTSSWTFWKESNNVLFNTTDLETAKANYAKLKNQDDWSSIGGTKVTYEGKSVPMSYLFSRYNHDSAVETLNSLPDTSEYLATAGGTNTIKFYGIRGALTDGGAINTLTEEEIAVATAKGWTVTYV